MTDKEKQIREMASDMDYACTKHDLWLEDAKEIAKVLYALGYRKCPNNSRCHKCVYEMNCLKDKDNNRQCPDYKKDSPDGGYYG